MSFILQFKPKTIYNIYFLLNLHGFFSEHLFHLQLNFQPVPLQPRGLINRRNWCYINAVSFHFINNFLAENKLIYLSYCISLIVQYFCNVQASCQVIFCKHKRNEKELNKTNANIYISIIRYIFSTSLLNILIVNSLA